MAKIKSKEEKKILYQKIKEWKNKNKEKISKQKKERYNTKKGRAIAKVNNYKYKDRKYNRGECTLTYQWVIENIFSGQKCYYCGETDWHKLGCDRIDNSKPHTEDNVVCCCSDCNNKKQKMNYQDFIKKMLGNSLAS